jgi:hypothetical protein
LRSRAYFYVDDQQEHQEKIDWDQQIDPFSVLGFYFKSWIIFGGTTYRRDVAERAA